MESSLLQNHLSWLQSARKTMAEEQGAPAGRILYEIFEHGIIDRDEREVRGKAMGSKQVRLLLKD